MKNRKTDASPKRFQLAAGSPPSAGCGRSGGWVCKKQWRKGLQFKRRSLRSPTLYPLENSALKASPPRGRVTQFGRANPTCAFRHTRVSLCGTTPSLTWYRNPAVNGGLLQVSMLDLDCELLGPVSPRRFRV